MEKVLEKIMEKLNESEQEMIKIRRHLHEHPELSFHEKETSEFIKNFYQGLDCKVTPCGEGYGYIVDIDSGHPGPKLALRADFDALAIQEDNDLPFKSQNPGVMHACGHDGHTAYLLILARTLIEVKDQLKGSIRILHQPAEEVAPGGALGMIKAGCLENVDNVVGVHVMSTMETGSVAYHAKETQTGRSGFTAKITGKGGHASMPQLSNDPVIAASYAVMALQTIVSRRIDPFDSASLTIGSFDGAGTANAIKESVTLIGDVRVMKDSTRQLVREQVKQILDGVSQTFGVKVDLDYDDNYPVLYNDPDLTERVANAIQSANIPEVKAVVDSGVQDPSEDFAYYAQKLPSCFFYVGCMMPDHSVHPHHSPDFMMNEDALLIAAKSVAAVTVDYLLGNK